MGKEDQDDPSWRGFPLKAVYNKLEPYDLEHFPPVQVSYDHTILYKFPIGIVDLKKPPKPYKANEIKWDSRHVLLPNAIESQCKIFDEYGNEKEETRNRWDLICEVFSKPIKNLNDLQTAISMYNPNLKDVWNFKSLDEFDTDDTNKFFEDLLPRIVSLALQLPELIQAPIPLLKQNKNRSLSITQQQISCLLANAFLCTFPQRYSDDEDDECTLLSEINFNGLFQLIGPMITQKMKCLLNYFNRVCPESNCSPNVPTGVITFMRRNVDLLYTPDWSACEAIVGDTIMHIEADGVVENAIGLLQVDFANSYVGGSVLDIDCNQEEIRFLLNPELIVLRLFIERLDSIEALFMIGCEQYNTCSGYSNKFKWIEDHIDTTPRDNSKRRIVQIVAIDAISLPKPEKQYKEEYIFRELNKAYVGFLHELPTPKPGIATGNWGCGDCGGDPLLKVLIQLMVCTMTERPLVYYTFYDTNLRDSIFKIYKFLRKRKVRLCDLLQVLLEFESNNLDTKELYSFVRRNLKKLYK